tara:strand:+ start:132 stop:440 length:309 start_codon:yes stop_codon:yes gene_type:complete
MVFILLIIFPTPAGKFLIDIAGGIFLMVTLIPLIIGGFGWFYWKRIQSKMQTCDACGSSFFNSQIMCPICGAKLEKRNEILENIPASAATIDITPEDMNLKN